MNLDDLELEMKALEQANAKKKAAENSGPKVWPKQSTDYTKKGYEFDLNIFVQQVTGARNVKELATFVGMSVAGVTGILMIAYDNARLQPESARDKYKPSRMKGLQQSDRTVLESTRLFDSWPFGTAGGKSPTITREQQISENFARLMNGVEGVTNATLPNQDPRFNEYHIETSAPDEHLDKYRDKINELRKQASHSTYKLTDKDLDWTKNQNTGEWTSKPKQAVLDKYPNLKAKLDLERYERLLDKSSNYERYGQYLETKNLPKDIKPLVKTPNSQAAKAIFDAVSPNFQTLGDTPAQPGFTVREYEAQKQRLAQAANPNIKSSRGGISFQPTPPPPPAPVSPQAATTSPPAQRFGAPGVQNPSQYPVQSVNQDAGFNDIGREDARIMREKNNPNTRYVDKPDANTSVDLLRQAQARQQSLNASAQSQVFGDVAKPTPKPTVKRGLGLPPNLASQVPALTPKFSKGSMKLTPKRRGTIADALVDVASEALVQPLSDLIFDHTIRPAAEHLLGRHVPTASKQREYNKYEEEYKKEMEIRDALNATQRQGAINELDDLEGAPPAPILPPRPTQRRATNSAPVAPSSNQSDARPERAKPARKAKPAYDPAKDPRNASYIAARNALGPNASQEEMDEVRNMGLQIHNQIYNK